MIESGEHRCNGCGKKLTTGNSIDYVLKLKAERLQAAAGPVTDMMIYPAFDSDHFFCGESCLYMWLTRRMETRREQAAKFAAISKTPTTATSHPD